MPILDLTCQIPTIGDTRHWEGLGLVLDACHRRVEHLAAQGFGICVYRSISLEFRHSVGDNQTFPAARHPTMQVTGLLELLGSLVSIHLL